MSGLITTLSLDAEGFKANQAEVVRALRAMGVELKAVETTAASTGGAKGIGGLESSLKSFAREQKGQARTVGFFTSQINELAGASGSASGLVSGLGGAAMELATGFRAATMTIAPLAIALAALELLSAGLKMYREKQVESDKQMAASAEERAKALGASAGEELKSVDALYRAQMKLAGVSKGALDREDKLLTAKGAAILAEGPVERATKAYDDYNKVLQRTLTIGQDAYDKLENLKRAVTETQATLDAARANAATVEQTNAIGAKEEVGNAAIARADQQAALAVVQADAAASAAVAANNYALAQVEAAAAIAKSLPMSALESTKLEGRLAVARALTQATNEQAQAKAKMAAFDAQIGALVTKEQKEREAGNTQQADAAKAQQDALRAQQDGERKVQATARQTAAVRVEAAKTVAKNTEAEALKRSFQDAFDAAVDLARAEAEGLGYAKENVEQARYNSEWTRLNTAIEREADEGKKSALQDQLALASSIHNKKMSDLALERQAEVDLAAANAQMELARITRVDAATARELQGQEEVRRLEEQRKKAAEGPGGDPDRARIDAQIASSKRLTVEASKAMRAMAIGDYLEANLTDPLADAIAKGEDLGKVFHKMIQGMIRDLIAYALKLAVIAAISAATGIPMPMGGFLGGAIGGGGRMPSAAGGWDVPKNLSSDGVVARIHGGERVLPADVREGLDNLIATGGGNVTLSVQTMDAASFDGFLGKPSNMDALVRRIQDAQRNGRA